MSSDSSGSTGSTISRSQEPKDENEGERPAGPGFRSHAVAHAARPPLASASAQNSLSPEARSAGGPRAASPAQRASPSAVRPSMARPRSADAGPAHLGCVKGDKLARQARVAAAGPPARPGSAKGRGLPADLVAQRARVSASSTSYHTGSAVSEADLARPLLREAVNVGRAPRDVANRVGCGAFKPIK